MGTILKVVSIPRGSWHDLEEVLLEEMTVFRVGYSIITYSILILQGKRMTVESPVNHQVLSHKSVIFLQEPTAITAMELSTKQVLIAVLIPNSYSNMCNRTKHCNHRWYQTYIKIILWETCRDKSHKLKNLSLRKWKLFPKGDTPCCTLWDETLYHKRSQL